MDIRERLADAYERKVTLHNLATLPTDSSPERKGWMLKNEELRIEIEWLERRLRDEIEEQLESDFAMSYATKKAEERSHEVGDEPGATNPAQDLREFLHGNP